MNINKYEMYASLLFSRHVPILYARRTFIMAMQCACLIFKIADYNNLSSLHLFQKFNQH